MYSFMFPHHKEETINRRKKQIKNLYFVVVVDRTELLFNLQPIYQHHPPPPPPHKYLTQTQALLVSSRVECY